MGFGQILAVAAGLWLVFKVVQWLNHPLKKFPGPFWASISNAPFSRDFFSGRHPFRQLDLHDKYGPVVRIAPKELLFNTPNSWRDIYTVRKGGDIFLKGDFYDGAKFAGVAASVISERDPEKHAEMRKYLASGFSDRSLRAQEPLIDECVDALVDKMGQVGNVPEGVNMMMWYHLTTFDIIGSLAFGQDFGGVDTGTEHFWVEVVTRSMRLAPAGDMFRRFPWIGKAVQVLFPGQVEKILEDGRKHQRYTRDVVQKRLASRSDRPDFLTKIIDARNIGSDINELEICAHVSDFVIAGSETTATTLSCVTYYLLKQPELMSKLKSEIQLAFSRYEDITAATAVSLKYLRALCLEAMRMYPPLPLAVPRIVPKGGATVDDYFVPEGTTVATSPFAASMSSRNFKDPWKFDPERWLTGSPTDALDASQPFLLGPRACLGRSLGWMELATIMTKLIYRYDLELVNKDLDWLRDSAMRTAAWDRPNLMVRVKPRVDVGLV